MLVSALLCAVAAIHFYIFSPELPAYGAGNFRRVFRIPPEQLPIVRSAFNNLAVYNLALCRRAALIQAAPACSYTHILSLFCYHFVIAQ